MLRALDTIQRARFVLEREDAPEAAGQHGTDRTLHVIAITHSGPGKLACDVAVSQPLSLETVEQHMLSVPSCEVGVASQ